MMEQQRPREQRAGRKRKAVHDYVEAQDDDGSADNGMASETIPGSKPSSPSLDFDHSCPECGLIFQTKANLIIHMFSEHSDVKQDDDTSSDAARISSDARPESRPGSPAPDLDNGCPACGLILQDRAHLIIHIFREHSDMKQDDDGSADADGNASDTRPESKPSSPATDFDNGCPVCGLILETRANLISHMFSEHSDVKPDDDGSADAAGMASDTRSGSKPSSPAPDFDNGCPVCGLILETKADLIIHMFSEHSDEKQDDDGSADTGMTSGARPVSKPSSPDPDFDNGCSVCGLILETKAKLISHMFSEHSDVKQDDDTSSDAAPIASKTRPESRSGSPALAFDNGCPVCGLMLQTQADLITHMFIEHSDVKQDDEGSADAGASSDTRPGSQPRSPAPDIGHGCPVCGLILKTKANLRSHKFNKHSDLKPHVCDMCNQSFKRRTTLQRHMRTHTGECPYTCSLCQRTFKRQDAFSLHMHKHYLAKETSDYH